MRGLCAEEDEESRPDIAETDKQRNDTGLCRGHNVGKQRCGNQREHQREERIAGCHKDILERALAFKQRRQTPVGDDPQCQRQNDRACLLENGGIRTRRVEQIASADRVIVERKDNQPEDGNRTANRTAFLMFQIPETIKRVVDHMERIEQFFPIGLFADTKCSFPVLLLIILREASPQENKCDDRDRQDNEVLLNPLLADFLESGGVVRGVISRLEIFHGFLILAGAAERTTDADISKIEVGVALQDLLPVGDRLVKFTLVFVADRGEQDVAVFGALVDGEEVVALIEQQHLVALVCDRFNARQVAELSAAVAEGKQQMTVLIVGVDLLTALVDDRPGVFRSDGNVDQTRDRRAGDIDFTGRCKVTETVHDFLAGGVQLANRRVFARLVFQLCILLCLTRGAVCSRGHVDEAFLIDRDVVVLGRDIGRRCLSLLCSLEVSPDDVPCAVDNVLRADEAGEFALARQYDNTLIGCGRNDVDSVILVDRNGDRFVNGVFAKQCARGLCENLLEVAVDVEDNQAVGIGIADENLLGVCKDAGGIGELIRHALVVDERVDGELQLVVCIGDHDAVVCRIDNVDAAVRTDKQVARVVNRNIKPDIV